MIIMFSRSNNSSYLLVLAISWALLFPALIISLVNAFRGPHTIATEGAVINIMGICFLLGIRKPLYEYIIHFYDTNL